MYLNPYPGSKTQRINSEEVKLKFCQRIKAEIQNCGICGCSNTGNFFWPTRYKQLVTFICKTQAPGLKQHPGLESCPTLHCPRYRLSGLAFFHINAVGWARNWGVVYIAVSDLTSLLCCIGIWRQMYSFLTLFVIWRRLSGLGTAIR